MNDAELIVVSGPLAGERFLLSSSLEIGRAPAASIQLDDPEAAWHHCTLKPEDDHYLVTDHRSAHGTYVNGLRVTRHVLEDGDQISIGDTVFLFRLAAGLQDLADSTQTVLLRACSFLFLLRALVGAASEEHRTLLESQILRLLGDLVPAAGGRILLAPDEAELIAAAPECAGLIARLAREGPAIDQPRGLIGVPLYVGSHLGGAILVRFPAAELPRLAAHSDTLSAVATLAASTLATAREVERLRNENAILSEEAGTGARMIGSSPAIRKLQAMLARVAPLDTSVLLLGESGTGKEVVARALHQGSPRRHRPFMAINCAAITETLLESELFGHEKGAFTGAVTQKKGKLESAEGGTVFLDEIGELALPLQAKLLRVLQQREFERVGGVKTLRLDVRLIAATNRDLAAEARRGAFREDLYHRLNVVALRTPPLRERPEDIPELALFFLQAACARCRRRVTGISPAALRCLTLYSWPGNVRELENAIERAVVLGAGDTIEIEDLPETVREPEPAMAAAAGQHTPLHEAKCDAIVRAWTESHGDYKAAARLLGVHPNSLLRMIRTLGLRDLLRS